MVAAGCTVFGQPGPESWIPARWGSHDPATLGIVAGTPVNCLLLEPAHWDEPFLRAARQAGVAVLGVLHPEASAGTIAQARSLPFDGVVLEGDFTAPPEAGFRLRIELPSRVRIRLDTNAPIVGSSQGLWPGLEIEHSGKTVAGPTSAPWINTNGGFLRFLRARTSKTVWLGVQPPPRTLFPVERYLQAIGDAAIAEARWILSFDSDFEQRIYRREPAAMRDWLRVVDHLNFYSQWERAAAYGRFGVITSAASGGLLSGFLLDMLAAQRTSAVVIPPAQLNDRALKDVDILLQLDRSPLAPSQLKVLERFAARGGVVLEAPPNAQFPVPDIRSVTPSRRELDRLQGLWEMIYNATLRKNFGVRAFNTTGVLTGILAPVKGRGIVVHLVNFTDFEGEAITVHVLGDWKRARLLRPDRPVQTLEPYRVKEGTAVEIERFATVAAIHFE